MTEARILKARGARQHPRSGAGRIKDDGSDENYIYEVKDARKSYTLKAKTLVDLFRRGAQQGKGALTLIYFSDIDATAEVRLIPGGRELVRDG